MKTSRILILVVLACAVALAQDSSETGEVERLVRLGNEAYARGDYQAANELYGQAMDIDPWHMDAGTRQILALLRSALELGDRGAAFDNVVDAFNYIKTGTIPEDMVEEVAALQEILDGLPARDEGARSDAVVSSPVLLRQVAPEYPRAAQRRRVEGDARVRLLIGIDGAIKDIRVLEVPQKDLGFEEAVTAAVRRWRFDPATEDGRPISAWVTIRIPFRAR
jgi:TonB family protein